MRDSFEPVPADPSEIPHDPREGWDDLRKRQKEEGEGVGVFEQVQSFCRVHHPAKPTLNVVHDCPPDYVLFETNPLQVTMDPKQADDLYREIGRREALHHFSLAEAAPDA